MRTRRVALSIVSAITLAAPFALSTAVAPHVVGTPHGQAPATTFDLDHGNSAVEIIIPAVIPATLTSVSPGASDASLVLRITQLVTNGWFDAIAPYHPTAVGVYSDLGRRPAAEGAGDHHRNVAMLHSSYHVLLSLMPQHEAEWRQMLLGVGLDPDDDSMDLTTPVGIGNAAGLAVVQARERDGMNQLGDEPGSLVPGQPYADTTGYSPVNTYGHLEDPLRWQPLLVTDGNGIYRSQVFITPQWATVEAYSYDDVSDFSTPAPIAGNPRSRQGRAAYRDQADEVFTVSQSLTDEQKMTAEFFDNKFVSLGFSALFVYQSRAMTLEEFVHYDFLLNVAATDAGIAVWNEKARHDAVRPVTAIRHLAEDDPARTSWSSYLATADHPEYPSGSAGFCAAHAQASRVYLGTDDLGWEVTLPAGSSTVEPGVVPAEEITLAFETWTEFEEACGLSRLYGGVHFRPAITQAQAMTGQIGDLAHDFLQAQLTGGG